MEQCRICFEEESDNGSLVAPCVCSGSMKFVHPLCLNTWIAASKSSTCEICKQQYDPQFVENYTVVWKVLVTLQKIFIVTIVIATDVRVTDAIVGPLLTIVACLNAWVGLVLYLSYKLYISDSLSGM
jgi:E3 ubiquitin-protein ligase DOA10